MDAKAIEASVAAVRQRALVPLEYSVKRTLGRATKRLGKTESTSKLFARRQRTVAKQERQLEEVRRIGLGITPTGAKEFRKLGERVEKYKASAEAKVSAIERGELLGRIATSIKGTIDASSLTMESTIKWAGAQNDGGKVGKGATLPARTFLEWTPDRINKFVEIAQEYMIEKLEKRAAKKTA